LTEIGAMRALCTPMVRVLRVRDRTLSLEVADEPSFRGDTTTCRSSHGLESVRQVTRVSNEIAVHALEVDVAPGPAWAQVGSSTHARLSIVLEAIGRGRVESRLKRDRAPANGPFTMNFAPPGAEVWGYSDGIRRVRDVRLDFDLSRVSTSLGEEFGMPEPRVFHSERLHYLAKCLAAECENPDQYTSLYIDGLTLAMCVDFLRAGAKAPARTPGRLAPRQLRRVTEYLIEHLAEAVRLGDLAALTGLSLSQLGRAFKASTGLSPHRWQLNSRIGKAQELLLSSSMHLSEIALVTGFVEQSHFSRVFKSVVGASPGAWQREHAKRRRTADPHEAPGRRPSALP
jgi:AraC-like DNA-binding protein